VGPPEQPTNVEVRRILTPEEWAHAVAIRLSVFVGEQGVPLEEEIDAHDADAVHVLAWLDKRPAGTGRYYSEDDAAVIGRMAVRPWVRRAGVGGAILEALLAAARAAGLREARLAAQLHARDFYAEHRFVAEGPLFTDAGILHQRMTRRL
jgi:predicted GNAT family N-acyltransferase